MVKKFNQTNVKFYCPLSYGDFEYREEVISAGKSILGENFVPLIDYLNPDDYSRILSKMNVAIFYQERQQATGNIEIVSYYGAKVYLMSSSTTWDYYVNKEKRFFYDANQIPNQSFVEFIDYPEDKKNDNKLYFSKIWDDFHIKSIWDKIFK